MSVRNIDGGSSDNSNNSNISSQSLQQSSSSQSQQQQQQQQQQQHNPNQNHNHRIWASVSWMPHASLSQTSHVAISVRAALACIGTSNGNGTSTTSSTSSASSSSALLSSRDYNNMYDYNNSSSDQHQQQQAQTDYTNNNNNSNNDCWQVHVGVRGLAGLELVPVMSSTKSAPLIPIHTEHDEHEYVVNDNDKNSDNNSKNSCSWSRFPSVSEATHVCRWDNNVNSNTKNKSSNNSNSSSSSSMIQIPLRWRDLPRDAYFEFTVTGSRGIQGQKLYETATLSLFDAYGKLRSGLNKIPLFPKNTTRKMNQQDHHNNNNNNSNPGLVESSTSRTNKNPSSSSLWQQQDDDDDDDDPVWKASKILEQLDRLEEQHTSRSVGAGGNPTTTRTATKSRLGRRREASPSASASASSSSRKRGGNSNFNDVPSVPWLDQMARDYCEQTLSEATQKSEHHHIISSFSSSSEEKRGDSDETTTKKPSAYLIVEIPFFDVPVLHEETFYPTPQQGPSGSVTPLDVALYQRQKQKQQQSGDSDNKLDPPPFHPLETIPFLDYENEHDNPIDDKYRTLAHDLLRGLVDPALKPDRNQRDKLASIIASPSYHPTREEKDLLWRFRFSLVDNRRALTKFLLAVDWTVESEVVQAAELLEQWRKRSPIDVTDALKLLGKQVAYSTNLVRAYAIDTLASAPDEELNLYLLQLVQALKFENSIQQESPAGAVVVVEKKKSSLATFLITRASKNVLLANYLYWYLKVELQDPAHGARYREIFGELEHVLSRTSYPTSLQHPSVFASSLLVSSQSSHITSSNSNKNNHDGGGSGGSSTTRTSASSHVNKLVESVSKLGDKLRGMDAASSSIESETPSGQQSASSSKKTKNRSVWDMLSDQDTFISGIMDVQLSYLSKAKQIAKEMHIRSVLAKEGYGPSPSRISFPMPCAPEIMVNSVIPEKAKVFKSAVYPALIEFNVEHVVDKNCFTSQQITAKGLHVPNKQGTSTRGGVRSSSSDLSTRNTTETKTPQLKSYRVLMKTGDDLRQDQLAMMMTKLMDRLLKRVSLDLCITPYSIIATSPSSGIVEFVEQSMPLSAVLANHNNSILQFFQSYAPQKGAKYDVRPDVISNFVRSVAGGCVLTYLMGVGDRHLDNLMITKTGRFFHIDFGFMFGRDPKPLPPAFRLTQQMVDGMGGSESAEYRQFCSLACQAFNALRKSAGLVLNLLHLMSDAGIEDLSNNPSADADGVIAKVEERFRLDLTDEQAERFFLTLINDSLSAYAPRFMDIMHSIAVARR